MASTDEVIVGRRFVFIRSEWTEKGDAFWRPKHRFEHVGFSLHVSGRVDFVTDRDATGDWYAPDRSIYQAPCCSRTHPGVVNTGYCVEPMAVSYCIQPIDPENMRRSSLAPIADELLRGQHAPGSRIYRRTRYNHLTSSGKYREGHEPEALDRYTCLVRLEDEPSDGE